MEIDYSVEVEHLLRILLSTGIYFMPSKIEIGKAVRCFDISHIDHSYTLMYHVVPTIISCIDV